MASGTIYTRNKFSSDTVTNITNGTGSVRLYKRYGICTMVIDINHNTTSEIKFTIPSAYKSIGPIYHRFNYDGSDVYVYFYGNNTQVRIAQPDGNTNIATTITYIAYDA